MPFPLIPLLMALGPAAIQASRPTPTAQQPAPTAGGGGKGQGPLESFIGNFAEPPGYGPQGLEMGSLLESVPQQKAQAPPTTDLEGVQPNKPPGVVDEGIGKDQEMGDLLASIPEAMAMAGDLLGLNVDKNKSTMLVPSSGGGGQNQYAQAFGGLPRPPSLGEILAALPRLR